MAFPIPSMLLKQLYTFGSLKNSARGVEFQLKNRLSDATVTGVQAVAFDGVEVPLDAVSIDLGDGRILAPGDLDGSPIDFPLRRTLDVVCAVEPLSEGKHAIEVLGELRVEAAVKPLVEMLNDEVGDVRQRAYDALIKIGAPCVAEVIPLLVSEDDDLRQSATEILRKIGKPAVEPLALALGEADEKLQKRIMKVLDRMGYKRK